jgi:outer membrane lipoprotein-sorting protein
MHQPGGIVIMKALIYTAAAAIMLSVPAIAFAQQNNGPVTRAQVRAELAALESEGYNPNDWINYPENVQAAERRLAAKRAAEGK